MFEYSRFVMWSPTHLYTLLVIALITTALIWGGRCLSAHGQNKLRKGLALVVLFFYIAEYTWKFCTNSPTHIIKEDLPLHFCSVMALLCFIALWWEPRWARSLVYFGVLSASIQGLLTPAISYGFPKLDFFVFFISHSLLLISALAIPFLTEWKAKAKDPLRSVILMNVYLIVIHPINLCLGSNYGYTVHAPAGTILENLGTAPWYYLWLELPALALFYLMYLPVRRSSPKQAIPTQHDE